MDHTTDRSLPVNIETNYKAFMRRTAEWNGDLSGMSFHGVIASALFISATTGFTNAFVACVEEECGLGAHGLMNMALGGNWFDAAQHDIVASVRRNLEACYTKARGQVHEALIQMGAREESSNGARDVDPRRLQVLADEDERTG